MGGPGGGVGADAVGAGGGGVTGNRYLAVTENEIDTLKTIGSLKGDVASMAAVTVLDLIVIGVHAVNGEQMGIVWSATAFVILWLPISGAIVRVRRLQKRIKERIKGESLR